MMNTRSSPNSSTTRPFVFGHSVDEQKRLYMLKLASETGDFISKQEHEALIEAAQKQAFEQGRNEGYAQKTEADQEKLISEVQALGDSLVRLERRFRENWSAFERQSIDMALECARLLAASCMKHQPVEAIRDLIVEALPALKDEPRFLLRVPLGMGEALEKELEAFFQESGLEERIGIVESETLETSACEIEWSQGGLALNPDTVMARIREKIAAYFDSTQTPEMADNPSAVSQGASTHDEVK